MDIESQIIIISAVFGGICLILLIAIISLCAKVEKLNKERKSSSSSSNGRNDLYAYNNSTLQPDEELSKRGYVMHDVGKPSRLPNNGNDAYSIPRESIMQPGLRSTSTVAPGPIQRPSQFNQNYGAGAGGMAADRKQSKKELPNDFVGGGDGDLDDFVFGKQQQHPKQSLSQQQQERYPTLQQPQPQQQQPSNGPRHSQFNNNILYGNVNNQYLPPNQQQQLPIDDKAYYNNNRAINNIY